MGLAAHFFILKKQQWKGEEEARVLVLSETSRVKGFTKDMVALALPLLACGSEQLPSFLALRIRKMRMLHYKGSLNGVINSFNKCILTAYYVLAKDNKGPVSMSS